MTLDLLIEQIMILMAIFRLFLSTSKRRWWSNVKGIYSFRLPVVYLEICKKGQRIAQFKENGKKEFVYERIEGILVVFFQ